MARTPPTGERLAGNIVVACLARGLFGLSMGLWAPVMVLYFTAKGLSLTSFMVLMTAMNVTLVATAVPSGVVADRYSRKASVLGGMAVMTASVGLMIASSGFAPLVAWFALWGVGQPLALTAESALLYDTVAALHRETQYRRIAGIVSSVNLVATVAGTLASSLIVRFGMDAPMIAALASLAAGTVASLLYAEPPVARAERPAARAPGPHEAAAGHLGHLRSSLRVMAGNREVLVIAAANTALLRLYNLANRPFAQPALAQAGLDASSISLLFAGFFVLSALAARSAHLVDRSLGGHESRSLVLTLALAACSLALFAYARPPGLLALSLGGLYAANGLAGPVISASLNRRIESARRATCIAVVGMGESALGIALGPLYGWISDTWSLRAGMQALLWCFGPLLAACSALVLGTIRTRPAPLPGAPSELTSSRESEPPTP